MKELIESVVKGLVDNPEEVVVHSVQKEQATLLKLRVHPSDMGRLIGKQGRTIQSIRKVLEAAGMKMKRCFTLEILE